MPTVSNAAGMTGDEATTWRACASCGALTAYPPELCRCDSCQTKPTSAGWRHVDRRPTDRGRS